MVKKTVSGITLTLLLIGMLTLAFNIQPVKASETLYIYSDYTFTSNIYEPIVVTADNITIDGNGYTLKGFGNGTGFYLEGRSNVTIKNVIIEGWDDGIYLVDSSNNIISGNNITANNEYGIELYWFSSYNTISGNNMANNDYGIILGVSSNNQLYHNNFIDNVRQVFNRYPRYGSFWNNTVEGNYWSDYNGTDSDRDGIGDTPYQIDANNTDNHPLMGMFSSFNTSVGKCVNVISNSTVEDFEYFQDSSTIRMYVSNVTANQTFGFCRVCIPHTLMNVSDISVIIDDGAVEVLHFNETIYDNDTHRWIYFAYQHSTHEIVIVPEFPSFLILPLLMKATLLVVIVYRRKHFTKPKERVNSE